MWGPSALHCCGSPLYPVLCSILVVLYLRRLAFLIWSGPCQVDTRGDGELPVHAGHQNQPGAHGHSVGAGARGLCQGLAHTRVPLQQHHQTGADPDAALC